MFALGRAELYDYVVRAQLYDLVLFATIDGSSVVRWIALLAALAILFVFVSWLFTKVTVGEPTRTIITIVGVTLVAILAVLILLSAGGWIIW